MAKLVEGRASSLAKQREIARGAIRSIARQRGWTLESLTFDEVTAMLDDLARTEPELVASQWYSNASKSQWKMFRGEWRSWVHYQTTILAPVLTEHPHP